MDIKKHPAWSKISPYKKLAHLARLFIAKTLAGFYPRKAFIGITGSVGKTTTKEACIAILSQKFTTIGSKANIDPIFNIPQTLLKLRPKVQKVVLEMGIEHPGEMDFYLSLVKPATAIITRISFAHAEFLGDIEQITCEKGLLVQQLPDTGFAILNFDDLNVRKLAQETHAQVIFYGMSQTDCHVWASNIKIKDNLTTFELNYGVERAEINLPLLGKHFVYCALAGAALGLSCGMTLINIKKGLEQIVPSPHRLLLLEGIEGWLVLDDTYNSSPVALEEALNVLNELPARRRIVVLGEMRELGIYSEDLHRAIAQKIYKDKFDFVFLGGGDARFIGEELIKLGFLPERLEINLSNQQMVSKILRTVLSGDVVLVKGSRAVKLDEVVKRLTKK